MKEKPISNKRSGLRMMAIIFFTLVAFVLSFHLWFINNTERIFENIVSAQSQGVVKMKVKKVRFNYFSQNVRLEKVEITSTDSLVATNIYNFKVTDLRLKVQSIWTLIFNREISINSLTLKKPVVEIKKIRDESSTDTIESPNITKDISIAKELGKVYRTIQNALMALKIQHFEINEGKFNLVNALIPGQKAISISHIFLQIDNLAINPNSKTDSTKFLFSDNIILRTHDQEIFFPDGRHKLSFGNISINVKNKSIEIDSCEISGKKSDTGKIAFNMFFQKLQLINLDFSALAEQDLIKADSVYCQDPKISLSFNIKKQQGITEKNSFQVNDAIRQLGSNLDIKFAGLKNADVEITTVRHNNPVTFSSEGNNVYLYNLKIDNEASKPILISGFDVAIRNYEVITRDGSTAIKFDSIQLRNNTVTLNNFSLSPTNKPSKRSIRNINVPLLQLNGLSWEDLIVDHIIVAHKATFYNPTIVYKKLRTVESSRKQTLFNALSDIDDFMQVNQLELVNGHLLFELNPYKKLELINTSFLVNANKIVSSQSIKNIEQSIDRFAFSKAIIAVNNLRLTLNDVQYISGEKNISASSVSLFHLSNPSRGLLKDVLIVNLDINKDLKTLSADGLSWQEGEIFLSNLGKPKNLQDAAKTEIRINNILAKNTSVNASLNGLHLQTFLNLITANEFVETKNGKFQFDQLQLEGKDFIAKKDSLTIHSAAFTIKDRQPSFFKNNFISNYTSIDSLTVNIPSLQFSPSINSLIESEFVFNNIIADSPIITYIQGNKPTNENKKTASYVPNFKIENLKLNQPEISLQLHNQNKVMTVSAKNNNPLAQNFINLINFKQAEGELTIENASLATDHLLVINNKRKYGVDSGNINIVVTNVKRTSGTADNISFSGHLEKAAIYNLLPLSIKSNTTLSIDSINIQQANFNSGNSGFKEFYNASPDLFISNVSGKFADSLKIFNWYNAAFNKNKKIITIDSARYKPAIDLEEFKRIYPYQADYIEASTGKIIITNFNDSRYIKDSIVQFDKIAFTNPGISIFRDKILPYKSFGIKLLPADAIKKLASQVMIDTVQFNNGAVVYSELSNLTRDTGVVYLTRLSANIGPVKNINITPADSLILNARAYLLDTALIKLIIHQSYTDSLSGFTMNLQAPAFDMTILNPILPPLASVKIVSGKIDSFHLQVVGKEYYAIGKTKLVYDNLTIKLLEKGKENKPSLKNKMINLLANTFVVKDNNRNKYGITYFERLRDRSIFNYLVKITVSGFSTSIGIKSNKKTQKKYDKQLKKK